MQQWELKSEKSAHIILNKKQKHDYIQGFQKFLPTAVMVDFEWLFAFFTFLQQSAVPFFVYLALFELLVHCAQSGFWSEVSGTLMDAFCSPTLIAHATLNTMAINQFDNGFLRCMYL